MSEPGSLRNGLVAHDHVADASSDKPSTELVRVKYLFDVHCQVRWRCGHLRRVWHAHTTTTLAGIGSDGKLS